MTISDMVYSDHHFFDRRRGPVKSVISSMNHKTSASTKANPQRKTHSYCVIESPVGRLLLAGNAQALTHVSFQDGRRPTKPDTQWTYSETPFHKSIQQLNEYFSGKRKTFTIKLAPEGTPFQRKVWDALQTIPYGRTLSYGQIANAIGKPQAVRAVGAANGQNPLSIVIPCHRVIGSNGKLVGFGGGLSIKEALLSHERRHAQAVSFTPPSFVHPAPSSDCFGAQEWAQRSRVNTSEV